jgi:acyl carrier protein
MNADPPGQAELVEQVLELFAREARVDRQSLRMDARAEELGIESLDLAVALFEIEDRFGVTITEPLPGSPAPTLGDIVRQVLARRAQSLPAPGSA